MSKRVLDVTCGGRMMWFNKKHPDVTYLDKRECTIQLCDGREFEVKPDVIADFTDLPFEDNTFSLVVFDPPHFKKLGKSSWLAQKYGYLLPSWEVDLKAGYYECMRVLKKDGVLIFKWNEAQIPVSTIVNLFEDQPLFGHPTAKQGKTIWITYMK